MIDVNLGNKTLIVGVAIALILSYGMVNFNGAGPTSDLGFSKVEATSYTHQARKPAPERTPVEAMANVPVEAVDGAAPADLAAPTDSGIDTEALSAADRARIAEIGTPTNRFDAWELKKLQSR